MNLPKTPFCFIHTFVRMDCDLCQGWGIFENVMWGTLTFLKTRHGLIALSFAETRV